MPLPPSVRPLRCAVALVAAIAFVAVSVGLPEPAVAATRTPATPTGLPAEIEDYAAYVPATSCSPVDRRGSVALGRLLTTTYRGTSYGIGRDCGSAADSEHDDGRAVDWMNSIRDKKQAAQAKAVLRWLFTTDAAGNEKANARRLGVMYIIWNGKIWGAYSADRGWRDYSSCAEHQERAWDSTCHRDHMHLSLSWEGARAKTSFWSKRVAAPDYGPCRPAGLSWAYTYQRPNRERCNRVAAASIPRGSSATYRALATYSGLPLRPGKKGPAVTAVQRALNVDRTGSYGVRTKAAVKAFQQRRGLSETGHVGVVTWRHLLRVKAPR